MICKYRLGANALLSFGKFPTHEVIALARSPKIFAIKYSQNNMNPKWQRCRVSDPFTRASPRSVIARSETC
jgi:hypothetical protein